MQFTQLIPPRRRRLGRATYKKHAQHPPEQIPNHSDPFWTWQAASQSVPPSHVPAYKGGSQMVGVRANA
jgi:hypothetical protein